jgi:hypothetical protein
MARVALTNDLKAAVSALSSKEKDKILFRLIALKPDLAAQLEFQLLENGETTEERRNDVQHHIQLTTGKYRYESPRYILWLMQSMSSEITRHVKTTKDKYGDVWLNFYMIDLVLEKFGADHVKAKPVYQIKLNLYLLKRLQRVLNQMVKLEPDYHLDFKAMRNRIGHTLNQNQAFLEQAKFMNFNMDWLTSQDATPRGL